MSAKKKATKKKPRGPRTPKPADRMVRRDQMVTK
jgi:hypothetical protein